MSNWLSYRSDCGHWLWAWDGVNWHQLVSEGRVRATAPSGLATDEVPLFFPAERIYDLSCSRIDYIRGVFVSKTGVFDYVVELEPWNDKTPHNLIKLCQ